MYILQMGTPVHLHIGRLKKKQNTTLKRTVQPVCVPSAVLKSHLSICAVYW